MVGGRDGGATAKKGVCEERLLQIVLETSPGCDLTPGSPAQARLSGSSKYERQRRKGEGGLVAVAWGWHIDAA